MEYTVRVALRLMTPSSGDIARAALSGLLAADPDADMAEGTSNTFAFWTTIQEPKLEVAITKGAERVRAALASALGATAGDAWPPGVVLAAIEGYAADTSADLAAL